MKNPRYDLLIFDWNGTLSTARQPLAHYKEGLSVPALYTGVKSVLKALHDQGYTLAVASAASKSKLQFETAHHEIDRYFSLLAGGDGLYNKPDPEMLLDIINRLGVEPQQTLMIGDTEADMEMAAQARIDGLAVCYGLGNKEQLAHFNPAGFINSINELPEWLNAKV
ncbi:MAG: family hydrolase [Gammaproteobacteria bacterium]|jgi:phosphoglycolate phosphatase|nr:family hydrolase [Gammaproteobacteria bacterium]